MKLERAIELNNKVLSTFDYRLEETEKDAIKLGNAAMENKIEARKYHTPSSAILLPGETE